MGRERAWVVHGLGDDGAGMDDISISGATTIAELADGKVSAAVMDVSWLGVSRASVSELQGGDARQNAETIEGILSGKIRDAKRDMTVVNAAGGFVVAGLAKRFERGNRSGARGNRQRSRIGKISRAAKFSAEKFGVNMAQDFSPGFEYNWQSPDRATEAVLMLVFHSFVPSGLSGF